jgi:hypothetical protein
MSNDKQKGVTLWETKAGKRIRTRVRNRRRANSVKKKRGSRISGKSNSRRSLHKDN